MFFLLMMKLPRQMTEKRQTAKGTPSSIYRKAFITATTIIIIAAIINIIIYHHYSSPGMISKLTRL